MIIEILRTIVSRNVILYKIYFFLIRSRIGNKVYLPNSSDDLYVDGFPRSGNTYLVGMINNVFKKELKLGSHHLHSIAGLKMAIKFKLKIFVLVREPTQAITSFLIIFVFLDVLL